MARELSLTDHLRELRRRILICVIAILAGSVAAFAFYKQIIHFLSRPAYDLEAGSGLDLVFIEVTELLTTAVKVSFVAGFVLALPVILYQVVMFVAPGLQEGSAGISFYSCPRPFWRLPPGWPSPTMCLRLPRCDSCWGSAMLPHLSLESAIL